MKELILLKTNKLYNFDKNGFSFNIKSYKFKMFLTSLKKTG